MNTAIEVEMTIPGMSTDQIWTYEQIAARAREIRDFFTDHHARVHRDSTLGVLLRGAEVLAQEWASGTDSRGINGLIAAAHVNRIADAIDSIRTDATVHEHLRRIAGNSVNLSDRTQSKGKDALWELELLARLRRCGFSAALAEPDIVFDLNGIPYSVACKKVYSERGVQAQVRKGAKQLEAARSPGLIALNLDDLVPIRTLLEATTLEQAHDFMHAFNVQFIQGGFKSEAQHPGFQ